MKRLNLIIVAIFCIIFYPGFLLYAQSGAEKVELVTYYPAPFGSYDSISVANQLDASTAAVAANSLDIVNDSGSTVISLMPAGNISANGSLTVAANTQTATLNTTGDAAIGGNASIAGTAVIPTISGNTSITGSLTVNTAINVNNDTQFMRIGSGANPYRLRVNSNRLEFYNGSVWLDLTAAGDGSPGEIPIPIWDGTKLHFEDSTGRWLSAEVDLAGSVGAKGDKGDPGISGQTKTISGSSHLGLTSRALSTTVYTCHTPWQIVSVDEVKIYQKYPDPDATATFHYNGTTWHEPGTNSIVAHATAASYLTGPRTARKTNYYDMWCDYTVTMQER